MSQEIFRKLRQMLMEKLDVYRELTDQEILETIDELIVNTLRESGVSLKEKVQLRQELFYSVRKLDVLQELIEDETVTEIMVNGPDSIFVERKGKLTRWPKSFTDQEKLEDVIQQIVGKCNRIVNESSPIVDARLEIMTLMAELDLPLQAVRRQIASGVDILVHLGRMRDKSRKLLEVSEVCAYADGEIRIQPLYQWQDGCGLVPVEPLLHREKLERAGVKL